MNDIIDFDLQLFAEGADENEDFDYANADIALSDDFEDEEINSNIENDNTDIETDTEVNSENETETNTETDVEDVEEKEVKKPMSKETKALIQQKKANKELRDKLVAIEKEKEQQRLETRKIQLAKQYVEEEGYEDDKALKLAEKDIKSEALEARLDRIEYMSQAEKLVNKYPDVIDELHRLIPLCKQTGWSLEKICRAELNEVSTYDVRTKAEQETLAKKTKGEIKKIDNPSSSGSKENNTALSKDQERLYQMYVKAPWGKGKSRKDFLETINAKF